MGCCASPSSIRTATAWSSAGVRIRAFEFEYDSSPGSQCGPDRPGTNASGPDCQHRFASEPRNCTDDYGSAATATAHSEAFE